MAKETVENKVFADLGIPAKLLDRLTALKFITPTPIQEQAIPIGLQGEDIVGIAQTGTGKTLAFTIPMLKRISETGGRGLVLLPTRELAIQVEEVMNKIGSPFGLRSTIIVGGAAMSHQLRSLKRAPHIIVATPGRLIDHLEQGTVQLDDVTILVLDEADRMLDMGFEPQIKRILETVPADRQTMLFSATMPAKISGIAAKYMKKPLRVEVAPSGTSAQNVTQELYVVNRHDKLPLLLKLITETEGAVLVFSRTKFGAKKISAILRNENISSAEIHSNRTLAQRRAALQGFKNGRHRVLVATDIASRGIDVTGIALVINYDLPDNPEDYVHRIGRTGRAGMKGAAVSFAEPNQRREVETIERLTKKRLDISPLPSQMPQRTPMPMQEERSEYRGEGSGGARARGRMGRSSGHSRNRRPGGGGGGQRRNSSGGGNRSRSRSAR